MDPRRVPPIPRTDPENGGEGHAGGPGEPDDPLGYRALRVSIDALSKTVSDERILHRDALRRLGDEMGERFARSDAQRAVDAAKATGQIASLQASVAEILFHLHHSEQDRSRDRTAIEEAHRAKALADETAAIALRRVEDLADITGQWARFEDHRASQNDEDAQIVRDAARKLVGVNVKREETKTKTEAADRRQFRLSMAAAVASGGIIFTLLVLALQQCGAIRTPDPTPAPAPAPAPAPPSSAPVQVSP